MLYSVKGVFRFACSPLILVAARRSRAAPDDSNERRASRWPVGPDGVSGSVTENAEKFGLSNTILFSKMEEALKSVLPIAAIVFAVCFALVPVPVGALLAFVFGSILLVIGMGLFTLGADIAMTPIGEHIGSAVTRTRSLWFILLISFLVGSFITVSEPDLQVLAGQVPNIPNAAIIGAVAAGVGVFLMLAMLRMFLGVPLRNVLIVSYALIIILAFLYRWIISGSPLTQEASPPGR